MISWRMASSAPDQNVIKTVADVIRNGGVVAFPTSTLYGLGVDARNEAAIQKIYDIKKRQRHHPILILISGVDQLHDLVKEIPAAATNLMKAFWPGGITMVFNANELVSPMLTGGTGKIGIRIPQHPIAAAIVAELHQPLTGTSANLSGQPGCARIDDLDPGVANQLDGIVDAGFLKGGRGSTVVDVTEDPPRIIREGTISKDQIASVLRSY